MYGPRQRPDRHGAHDRRIILDEVGHGAPKVRIVRVAGRDHRVAHDAVAPCALDGRAGKPRSERRIVER